MKNERDVRQSRQIGGLKTQNKFIRQDVKRLRMEVAVLTICMILLGLALVMRIV